MKKGGGGPSAPNPKKTARLQADLNRQAIYDSAAVNQTNIESPGGRQYYTGEIGGPDRTLNIELSPEGERAYGARETLGANLADYALANLGPSMMDRLGEDDTSAADALYQRGYNRLNPQYAEAEGLLQSRLMNQGIPVGSRAYQQAMDQFDRQRADAFENLALSSEIQGFAENRAQRSQAINELSALLAGAPAIGQPATQMPAQYQIAPPDLTGLTGQTYASEVSAYNAEQRRQAQEMGGLYSMAGMAAAAAIMMSDARLKRDIRPLGWIDGVKWYEFRYLWGKVRHVGVMAQEIVKTHPEAVLNFNGWLAVDYGKLKNGHARTAAA